MQLLFFRNYLLLNELKSFPTKVIEINAIFLYHFPTMKQKLRIILATYLACCIDKELYKAIEYLKEQVKVLIEQQQKQDKRILLDNKQRMRVAAKAKRLSRKIRDQIVYLGYKISKSSVKNILIENGYDPEPDLTVKSTWNEFIKSH